MNLNEQVCSLELAKRLKELGVKQESLFYWSENMRGEWSLNCPTRDRTSRCSAFTVAELGEMLFPNAKINTIKIGNVFYLYQFGLDKEFIADTEANARAKMMIYLLENKLIEVPKCTE